MTRAELERHVGAEPAPCLQHHGRLETVSGRPPESGLDEREGLAGFDRGHARSSPGRAALMTKPI